MNGPKAFMWAAVQIVGFIVAFTIAVAIPFSESLSVIERIYAMLVLVVVLTILYKLFPDYDEW